MSHADTILAVLRGTGGLTDGELVQRTGIKPHQQVRQICVRLARRGHIVREIGSRGLLVNRVAPSCANNSASSSPRVSAARAARSGPRWRHARLSDLRALDPRRTLFVLACSGSKLPGGVDRSDSGPRLIDSLDDRLASRLLQARALVRKQVTFDERTFMTACDRYTGHFWSAARPQLVLKLASDRLQALIVSGGYGVLLVREPIGFYNATFKLRCWADNVIADCVAAYASSQSLPNVIAFLAHTTDYARAYRGLERSANGAGLQHVYLVSAASDGRGGAMRRVPHTLGEAFAAHLSDGLADAWQSTDGLRLNVSKLGQCHG